MERISYDFSSSSDEDMSSSCSDETANRRKLGNNTTDKDEESSDKKQNVVYKLINREVNMTWCCWMIKDQRENKTYIFATANRSLFESSTNQIETECL